MRFVDSRCLLFSLIGLVSCGPESASRDAFLVEDSAGIIIATSNAPSWDTDRWSLSEQPVLQIGVVEGDSAYQLYRVRSAVRLSDGRIAVANDGSHEIRYFDSDGRHIKSVGRTGRGPGEFMNLYALVPLLGDSLLAGDYTLRRTTLLSPDGSVVRTHPGPAPIGILSDGSVITQNDTSPELDMARDGPVRYGAILIRHRLDGSDLDTIARLPGNESVQAVTTNGTAVGFTGYRRPFGLMRQTSTYEARIFTADGAAPEISVLDRLGELRGLIRYDQPNRAVTAADEAAYRDRVLGPIPPGPSRERAERAHAGDAFPSHMPAFQALSHDRVGNLWVQEYQADPTDAPQWIVFDPDGRWLGNVDTPLGLRITDIGADYVLGIARDDLDVEHVLMYALRKTGGPS